jgi:hypothetical protein
MWGQPPSAVHPNAKKALRRFLGHRARFAYDDLLNYLVMNAINPNDDPASS